MHGLLQFVGHGMVDRQVDVLDLHHLVRGHHQADVRLLLGLAAAFAGKTDRGGAPLLGHLERIEHVRAVARAADADHHVSLLAPVLQLLAEDVVVSHVVGHAGQQRHGIVQAHRAKTLGRNHAVFLVGTDAVLGDVVDHVGSRVAVAAVAHREYVLAVFLSLQEHRHNLGQLGGIHPLQRGAEIVKILI